MAGQFTIIWSQALEDKNLSPVEFKILATLQFFSGINGYCYPKLDTISQKSNISRRATISSIKHLVELGYVVKVERTRKTDDRSTSNCYYLNFNNASVEQARRKEALNFLKGIENDI